ncbi:MAG: sulfotransferase, partial [Candidatus Hydrogenedentes bacterium]|nr:sulfotransferase [Candidatus Hydrogenedentota bacterium]
KILPVFMERLHAEPFGQLQRVCRHIGYDALPIWREERAAQNVSRDRLRVSPLRDAIVYAPVIDALRRALIPKSVRARVKSLWQMRERPELSKRNVDRLKSLFDEDLATLGQWFGVGLTCDTFKEVTANQDLEWTSAVGSTSV